MKLVLKIGSFLGLGLTVVPAFFVYSGIITWDTHVQLMAVGAVLWFSTAPFWLYNENPEATH